MKTDKLSAFLNKFGVGGISESAPSTTPDINLRIPTSVSRSKYPIQFNNFMMETPNREFIAGMSPVYRNSDFMVGPYATVYGNPDQIGLQDIGLRGSVNLGKGWSLNTDASPKRLNAGLKFAFEEGGPTRKLKKYQEASQVDIKGYVDKYNELNKAINELLNSSKTSKSTGKTPTEVKDYLMSTSIGDILSSYPSLDESCTGPYCATAASTAMYLTYPNENIEPSTGGDVFRDRIISNPSFGSTSEDIYSNLAPGSYLQEQVLRDYYTDPKTKKLKTRSKPSYQSAHNMYIYDVKELDNGRKRIFTVQNPGSGPQILKEYDVDKEGTILRPDSDDVVINSGRLKGNMRPTLFYYKGNSMWSDPKLNDLIKERKSYENQILSIDPEYFTPKPTRYDVDYQPGQFLLPQNFSSEQGKIVPNKNNKDWIDLRESRVPEIVNQINDPEYKKMIMREYNISDAEYNAAAKTMMGQYMMESQGGTNWQSGFKIPENRFFANFMPKSWVWNKSLGPFQIKYSSLGEKTRKLYPSDEREALDFIYDPMKSSDVAMRYLAENVRTLRNLANQEGERQNMTPENYLDFLPYVISQPGWLRRTDEESQSKKGSILGEGVNRYIQGIKDYGDRLLEYVPMMSDTMITNPPTVKPEQQRDGGLTIAKAKEMLRDGSVHGQPLTDKQKRYFGWIAGGKKQDGGSLPMAQTAGQTRVYTDLNKFNEAKQAEQDSIDLYNRFKDDKNNYINFVKAQGIDPNSVEPIIPSSWVAKSEKINPTIEPVIGGILTSKGGGFERDSKGNARTFNYYPTISRTYLKIFDDTEVGKTLATGYIGYRKPVIKPVYQPRPKLEPVQFAPIKDFTFSSVEMQPAANPYPTRTMLSESDEDIMISGQRISKKEFIKRYGQGAWDKATNQGRYKKTGGSLGQYQGQQSQPGKVFTYATNPEYFDNRAVYSDDPRYNDLIRKMVYAGTHGFNPETGELVKLNQPVAVPADIQKLASQEGPTSQSTLFRNNPELRRKVIEASTNEAYQNPLMYAPGTIGMSMLPAAWSIGYGLGQSGTQAAQGNYGTAAVTAGLSALPLVPHVPQGVTYLKNDFIPRVLQSDLASKLVNENILSNLAARNVSLENLAKYNPVRIGSGGFGEAFELGKFPNVIFKKGLSDVAQANIGNVGPYESIPRLNNQIYPRYFSSGTNAIDREFSIPMKMDYQVMSRVPGKPLNELSSKQILSIPEKAWKELFDQSNFLRKNDVGIDWNGQNIFYNPKTQRFGIIDLTPKSSTTEPFWREQVLGNMSKEMSDIESKQRVKELMLKKIGEQFDRTSKSLKSRLGDKLVDNNLSNSMFTLTNSDKVFAKAFGPALAPKLNISVDEWVNRFRNSRNPNASHPLLDALELRKQNIFQNVGGYQKGGSLTDKQKEYFGWVFEQ